MPRGYSGVMTDARGVKYEVGQKVVKAYFLGYQRVAAEVKTVTSIVGDKICLDGRANRLNFPERCIIIKSLPKPNGKRVPPTARGLY